MKEVYRSQLNQVTQVESPPRQYKSVWQVLTGQAFRIDVFTSVLRDQASTLGVQCGESGGSQLRLEQMPHHGWRKTR